MHSKKIGIIIMGVSGVGKTTIGRLLSEEKGIPFFDADEYHSAENIQKMSAGLPLDDADRKGWLLALNILLLEELKTNSCILSCSALKKSYREILMMGLEQQIKFVFLKGSYEKILEQMKSREGHFIPPSLLQSQFDTLEKPLDAITISIHKHPEEIVSEICHELFEKSEIGIVGLGVMGKSLCRNFSQKGFRISMYNRFVEGKEEAVAENFKNEYPELEPSQAFEEMEAFIKSLQKPRKIILMVNAGNPVDQVIAESVKYLSKGDLILDGGNSYFHDTIQRQKDLAAKGIFFIGCGISGGEEGALKGPSLMPGGDEEAYDIIRPYLNAIAARDKEGKPCCSYMGESGSGHFVKMVHNGIEYAEMQLLAELYGIALAGGKDPDAIADLLETWKGAATGSYLLDITSSILREKENGDWLVNKIIDQASNKGTGNWATIEMSREGIPATLIATALFARYLSAYKILRTGLEGALEKKAVGLMLDEQVLRAAYEFARIINHFQGFWLIGEIFRKQGWKADFSEIARIWTNGCIIRSGLMQELVTEFEKDSNLFLSSFFIEKLQQLRPSLTKLVSSAIAEELAVPCFSEAVNFINALATGKSTANLIQAQRDYFGAHTYQRYDGKPEQYFHHQWPADV